MSFKRICKNCYWWSPFSNEQHKGNIGECHRFPPKAAKSVNGHNNRIFTKTNDYDFCGEFADRGDYMERNA